MDGLCWRIGKGDKVLIRADAGILEASNCRILHPVNDINLVTVVDIINADDRTYKRKVINNTFHTKYAGRVLRIPLAQNPHEDELVWRCNRTIEFTMKRAYKLLQIGTSMFIPINLQPMLISFYRKLWRIDLPTKLS